MTIRLEEIVYLHCHQQGKARVGGCGRVRHPDACFLRSLGVPVGGCFAAAPGQTSGALRGHCCVSAARKTFEPAPGCGAWLGSAPCRAVLCGFPGCDLQGKPSPGPQACSGRRDESKQGRKSSFSMRERQFPELSCLPSAFLTGNVSLIHVCVFSLLSLSLTVDSGGTVVLVSQDGIQRPPLRFPRGGHLLQFLSCLENGLLPHGQLDPPLWSQRGKVGTPKPGSFLSRGHGGFLLVFPWECLRAELVGRTLCPALVHFEQFLSRN